MSYCYLDKGIEIPHDWADSAYLTDGKALLRCRLCNEPIPETDNDERE